jgi:hypothetical protein
MNFAKIISVTAREEASPEENPGRVTAAGPPWDR